MTASIMTCLCVRFCEVELAGDAWTAGSLKGDGSAMMLFGTARTEVAFREFADRDRVGRLPSADPVADCGAPPDELAD